MEDVTHKEMILVAEFKERLHPEIITHDGSKNAEHLQNYLHISVQENRVVAAETTSFFSASEVLSKVLNLQWWVYELFVIGIFLVCLLLNYIVKKINESRLEERLCRMTKNSLGIPKQNIGFTTNLKSTNKKHKAQQAISMIFTKEENQRLAAQPVKPKRYGRDQNGFCPNTVASDWLSKGIKLVASDSFKSGAKDTYPKNEDLVFDSKVPQDVNLTTKSKVIFNPVDTHTNETQNVTDMGESFVTDKEEIETLTNYSNNEKSATNSFKDESVLMHTSDNVKTTSENSSIILNRSIQSKETEKSASSGNSEHNLFNKFLGNIYKISKLKSTSDIKDEAESDIKSKSDVNIEQKSDGKEKSDIKYMSGTNKINENKEEFYNSDITLVETPIVSTVIEQRESTNVSEDKIAIINDSNYVMLEKSSHTNRPTDCLYLEIKYEGDKNMLTTEKKYSDFGKEHFILASSYECKKQDSTNSKDNEEIKQSLISDALSKTLLLKTVLSEIDNHPNTNEEQEPCPKNTETSKEMVVENKNHLDKVLSKDDLDNETLLITHNFKEETESEISLPETLSNTKPKSDISDSNINEPSFHDNSRSRDDVLHNPRYLSTSETKPKSFFSDITLSPAEYSVRMIVSEHIYSDMDPKNSRSNFA